MTTTTRHAAPWTFRRFLLMLTPTRRPRVERSTADLLTGREAVARALFAEHVQGSRLDLAEYDHTPRLQAAWLAVADRRLDHARSVDRHVAAFHGVPDGEWIHLAEVTKRAHREAFYTSRGL